MTRWTIASSAAFSLALVAPASAQPTAAAKATAEALFRDGKRLMDQKRFPEACPKLEESYRIDPADGTLLNLALCHEAEGKTATAWAELKEARAAARKAGRADRERIADKHAADLEPRLSRLAISLDVGADVPGLVVELDGVALRGGAWGTAIPVDPGDHVVIATAPDRGRWEDLVQVDPGEQQTLLVPVLAPIERPAPPPPPPAKPAAPPWALPAGVAAGGVGLIALGTGVVFGIRAAVLSGRSDDHCKNGVCDADGFADYEDGRTAATVANITIPIGAVVLAAGGYLVLASTQVGAVPWVLPGTARTSVTPIVGPRVGAIALGGAF